jgi:hypothetical protein
MSEQVKTRTQTIIPALPGGHLDRAGGLPPIMSESKISRPAKSRSGGWNGSDEQIFGVNGQIFGPERSD